MRGEDPLNDEKSDRYERERIRYQWMLANVARFRLFFTGLVFALLSFSVQFSVVPKSNASVVNCIQVSAWLLLIMVGFLALRDAGGFVAQHTEDSFNGLSRGWRIAMWGMFATSLLLLALARILGL